MALSANWKLVFKTWVLSLCFSDLLLSQVSEMKDPGPFSSSHECVVILLGVLFLKPEYCGACSCYKVLTIYMQCRRLGFFAQDIGCCIRHPMGPDEYRKLCFSGVLPMCVYRLSFSKC